ncbi:F-box/LRR-repeat protein [Striga hermonthica]|uniref:F-box/LRR-repeat protein n=1 Tax=Striga hermonthica TaxID=68872 RepID=A0A9N7NEI6_STRHE|nr:F-box/LRR-repeat protein [Striga hermonthica]
MPNTISNGLLFSFPKLKVLVFHCTSFSLVNSVLLGCPVLEVLVVNCDPSCFQEERLSIRVPSLKVLWLHNMMNVIFCVLELDSPGLLHFYHYGYMPVFYPAMKMRSLSVARLNVNETGGQRQVMANGQAIVALNACSDVVRIYLSHRKMLYRVPNRIPSFPKLVDLGIIGMNHTHGWEVLLGFVARAPNLKNIYVKANFHTEGYRRFKAAVKETMSVVDIIDNPDMFQLKIERRNVQNGENCLCICGGAVVN